MNDRTHSPASPKLPSVGGSFSLLGLTLSLLLSLRPGFCAEPAVATPDVVTNYVTVTNVVIVTNYIVTTNLVLSTNVPGLVARPGRRPLPALSWVPPEDGYDWIQLKSGEQARIRQQ